MRELFAETRLRTVVRPFKRVVVERRFVVDRFPAFFVVLLAVFFAGFRAVVFVVRFVVRFADFLAALLAGFLAVFVGRFRGGAFARVFDRFVAGALRARVVFFFAGALRAPVFRARAARARLVVRGAARRRGSGMGTYGGQASSPYLDGGTAAYSGCQSSTRKARRPARHAAMMRAPNP